MVRALSLSPSLHSGMPDRKVRIFSAPTTSDRTTVPLLLTSRLTLSTTSRNTCRRDLGILMMRV